MEDEKEARNQLVNRWAQFAPADKARLVSEVYQGRRPALHGIAHMRRSRNGRKKALATFHSWLDFQLCPHRTQETNVVEHQHQMSVSGGGFMRSMQPF